MINIIPPVIVFCFLSILAGVGYFIPLSYDIQHHMSNVMIGSPVFFGVFFVYMFIKRGN